MVVLYSVIHEVVIDFANFSVVNLSVNALVNIPMVNLVAQSIESENYYRHSSHTGEPDCELWTRSCCSAIILSTVHGENRMSSQGELEMFPFFHWVTPQWHFHSTWN